MSKTDPLLGSTAPVTVAAPPVSDGAPVRPAAAVARSLYRTLKENGFTAQQIVNVSSELIGLVTADLPVRPVPVLVRPPGLKS